MASFVYSNYVERNTSGWHTKPTSWTNRFVAALVGPAYVPSQFGDLHFSDIPGGAVVSAGLVNSPTFALVDTELTYRVSINTGIWSGIAAAINVQAIVFYAVTGDIFDGNPLIAYVDNYAGLPFVTDGTDVTLVSLPNLDAHNQNVIQALVPAV